MHLWPVHGHYVHYMPRRAMEQERQTSRPDQLCYKIPNAGKYAFLCHYVHLAEEKKRDSNISSREEPSSCAREHREDRVVTIKEGLVRNSFPTLAKITTPSPIFSLPPFSTPL